MLKDRLALLLCSSSAPTEPEGMALLNAGRMTRPRDGRWMVAGAYDGKLVPGGQIPLKFQVFDGDDNEILIDGVSADEDVKTAETPAETPVFGRILIQVPVPPLDELPSGLYTLRVTVLNASQDILFTVPTEDTDGV